METVRVNFRRRYAKGLMAGASTKKRRDNTSKKEAAPAEDRAENPDCAAASSGFFGRMSAGEQCSPALILPGKAKRLFPLVAYFDASARFSQTEATSMAA